MKRFLVVQHSYSEFLGSFERLLEDRHIGFSYCRPFLGDPLPATGLHHDALWILGGQDCLGSAQAPFADGETRLIARFRRARRPIVGIGYGALVVAMQCGGSVAADTSDQAIFTRAQATAAGRSDPVAAAIDGKTVLLLHRGGVQLPAGVPALACDERGRWLLARPDPLTYALLFRPEHKPAMLEDMAMEEDSHVPENIGELISAARDRWDDTQALAAGVLAALVTAMDLMQERHKPPVIPVRAG